MGSSRTRVVQAPTPMRDTEPKPPSEEDVVQAGIQEQKKQRRKRGGNRGGYMSTVLQDQPNNKLG